MAPKIPEAKARSLFLKNQLEPLVPFPGTQKEQWTLKMQSQICGIGDSRL